MSSTTASTRRPANTERLAEGRTAGFPAGTDVLLESDHPRLDALLFAAFRDELGEPPAYRMPWDDSRSGTLARMLVRRGHEEATKLIEEASRLHPWKHFFERYR